MLKLFERKSPVNTDEQSSTTEDKTKSTELSVFKDPFGKAHIKRIDITYRKPLFNDHHVWEGSVQFENGLTSGKQETPQCDSWDSLMVHMKQIYDSLAVKP
jgi:hypothetical protein